MKTKIAELTGAALYWAVAKANGHRVSVWSGRKYPVEVYHPNTEWDSYTPATDWSQGGPIIEREKINITFGVHDPCHASIAIYDKNKNFVHRHYGYGPTPLIAAMRCFVASKLGDEVEIPDELR